MKKFLEKLRALRLWRPRRLLALCYAVFLAASLLFCAGSLLADRLLRLTGQMTERQLQVEDFALLEMEPAAAAGVWVSTTGDPRMTLEDCPAWVGAVDVQIRYLNTEPGEFTLFYLPRPEMVEFDAGYRLWARRTGEDTWSFALPAGRIYGLRMDPAIYTGVEMQIESITLNRWRGAAEFFVPSRPWAAAFFVIPALAASAIDTARLCLGAFRAPQGDGQKKERE